MSDVVIAVENLSKSYRLGVIGSGTLTNDLKVWWAKRRGRPNPLAKIGQADHHNRDGETVWALRDVSFTVKQGEVLGIIGKNGAGKSTLLKILSRVTAPTDGEVKVKGRIASLLEVGTGFHPELTGRENIYLNGAILGMRRTEIDRKLDEIVDFAGVETYLDTPVKRYSSGMYVRLAFAVAAHLEPEILVVDEVLAVGDAEFQKKCLGKMGEVAKAGRTVLFVSHNMGAVSTLTEHSLLLNKGHVLLYDYTSIAVAQYIASSYSGEPTWNRTSPTKNPIQINGVQLLNSSGELTSDYDVAEEVEIKLNYEIKMPIRGAVVAINIHASDGTHLISLEDTDKNPDLFSKRLPGEYTAIVRIPGNWLNSGTYLIRVSCGVPNIASYDNIEALQFTLVETGDSTTRGHRSGYLLPMLVWNTHYLEFAKATKS